MRSRSMASSSQVRGTERPVLRATSPACLLLHRHRIAAGASGQVAGSCPGRVLRGGLAGGLVHPWTAGMFDAVVAGGWRGSESVAAKRGNAASSAAATLGARHAEASHDLMGRVMLPFPASGAGPAATFGWAVRWLDRGMVAGMAASGRKPELTLTDGDRHTLRPLRQLGFAAQTASSRNGPLFAHARLRSQRALRCGPVSLGAGQPPRQERCVLRPRVAPCRAG
jgi:hypothetical protein